MTPDGLQSKERVVNEQSHPNTAPMWGLRRLLSETKRKKSPLWRKMYIILINKKQFDRFV